MPVQYQQKQKCSWNEEEPSPEFHDDSAVRNNNSRKQIQKNTLMVLAACLAAAVLGNAAHNAVFPEASSVQRNADELTDSDYLSNNNQSDAVTAEGFSIDGVHYDMDASVQDFLDNGWSLSFDEGDSAVEVLEPDAYISFSLYKSDASISAHVSNYSDESVDLKSQPLHSLSIADKNGRIVFPYGLKIGMDADEAENILTEHNLPWSSENNYYLVYKADMETRREAGIYKSYGYNDINIYFDDEDHISSISWYVYDNGYDMSVSAYDY